MAFWAYMLRCADGSFYVGHTDDLETRVGAHRSGNIPGYSAERLPVELVWSQAFTERDEAFRAERRIKGWSRAKKEALIRDDWDGLQFLSRKLFVRSFDTPLSAATQDERQDVSPSPLILSSGLSEVEGRVSKDEGRYQNPAHPEEGLSERSETKACLEGPVIVLVRPQLGQNIGKAARAMLNFGLTELRLVAPRDGWPNPDAGPAASGADIVLEKAKLFATTAEAIADCGLVFASTVRRRDLIIPVVGPEAMAEQIRGSPARSAILFGPERSGLASEDVALANAIVTVPINPKFGSLNLAQAVILLAYEWSRGVDLAQPPLKEAEPAAPMAELEGLIGQLDDYLVAADYFHPPERAAVTRATIRTILTKPRWSSREVKAMRGIIRALVTPRRGG